MPDSSSDRDPLDVLAEEFVTRFRAGQRPSLTEYAQRCPDLAEQIRELFPTLIEMEQLRPDSANQTGPFTSHAGPSAPDRLGDFRILREIGRGGMGVVYEAVQESLGRHVALKVLPPATLDDPRRLERFRREAQAAARLHHTNIVPVFGSGEAGGRHFFAMQFIQGQGLDTIIAEVRRLKSGEAGASPVGEVATALTTGEFAPLPDPAPASAPTGVLSGSFSDAGGPYWVAVARVGAQAADALAHAHEQGVLHRDVKPSNLLLDRHGTLWVTDFGLAKAAGADDLTAAGDVVGTLRYLAPERFEGPGDHRSDLYALGLTLYELLTLRPAFTAESRPQLVEQVLAANPARPRAVNRAVPRDLETIVLKATAKDPARRYQSAAALAEDLRRYLDDRPVLARRTSSAEKALRWCRRNPAVASLLAAVLTACAVGTGVSVYFAARMEAKATEAANGEQEAKDQRDTVRRLLHVSRINHAQTALADDRIDRVRQLLADTTPQKPGEPDLRGWEWHYLARQLRGPVLAEFRATTDLRPFEPGRGPRISIMTHFDLTPDGRRVVTSRREENGNGIVLEVWDTRSGRMVGRVPREGAFTPWHRVGVWPVAIAPDGRFVAVGMTAPPGKGGPLLGQVRVWEVETGAEVAGPPDTIGPSAQSMTRRLEVGPDAAWMIWAEQAPRRELGNTAADIIRWERASGKVTRTPLPALPPPGPGPGTMMDERQLSADGRALYRVTRFGNWPADQPHGEDDPVPSEWKLEGWDLAAAPHRPRWPTITLAHDCTNLTTVFSPERTTLAACDGREVVVYRLADGALQWRAPCARLGSLFGVSDDGARVAFKKSYRVTVLEKARSASPRELSFRWPGGARGEERAFLSGDGRTVLTVPDGDHIQVLDVARDPGLAAPGEAGRFLTRPGPARSTANPCVVVDAAGREVLRVALPPDSDRLYAWLVADDRRLLTNAQWSEREDDRYEWALYDTTRQGGARVGGGRGHAVAVPGTPWLVVADEAKPQTLVWESSSLTFFPRSLALHSALTGERVREIAVPPGEELCGWAAPTFDPTGTRYAFVTQPALVPDHGGQPSRPAGSLTLRMCEVATGRELWSAPVGDPRTGEGAGEVAVFFDPDGRRVFISNWDALLKPGAESTGRDGRPVFHAPEFDPNGGPKIGRRRVWVGRATDGTHERTLRLPPDRPDEAMNNSGFGTPRVLGFAADGRLLVAVSRATSGEVQLWDPDTGERTQSVAGCDGPIVWAALPAGGTRLFALTRAGRLHVWDMMTGRELLILPVSPGDEPLYTHLLSLPANNERGVWFDKGKVFVPGPDGVQVFDGSPLGP